MTERELKLLLGAGAVKKVHLMHAMMEPGYMVLVDGKPLESMRRQVRRFNTLDAAARLLFRLGIAKFAVELVND